MPAVTWPPSAPGAASPPRSRPVRVRRRALPDGFQCPGRVAGQAGDQPGDHRVGGGRPEQLRLRRAAVPDCFERQSVRCNWLDRYGIFSRHGSSLGQLALYLIGLLLTVVALLSGARFWFNLLNRLRNALG